MRRNRRPTQVRAREIPDARLVRIELKGKKERQTQETGKVALFSDDTACASEKAGHGYVEARRNLAHVLRCPRLNFHCQCKQGSFSLGSNQPTFVLRSPGSAL